MLKEEKINGKTYYQCEVCKFYYDDKKWAEKCKNFCDEHHACNVEITKHAVKIDKKGDCCR